MDQVKKTYAWQEAVALAKELVRICEEFSDSETNVLAHHIRASVAEVPAGIAADLISGRKPSPEAVIKLAAELELVHKIYPAIDTGEADERVAKLLERLRSKNFGESEPEPEPEEISPAELPHEPPQPAGGTIVAPVTDITAAGGTPAITSINPLRPGTVLPPDAESESG